MTLYDLHKKDSGDDDDSEDVIRERRAFRMALGIVTLLVGLGLVVNGLSTILNRLTE